MLLLYDLSHFVQIQHNIFNYFFPSWFSSRTFTIRRTSGKGVGYHFNSSLPLPSDSQTLRQQPGVYCRELTSAHSQQPARTGNFWFPSRSYKLLSNTPFNTRIGINVIYYNITILPPDLKLYEKRSNQAQVATSLERTFTRSFYSISMQIMKKVL